MTARILIIAGSDSGGGAGIQADIKTVTMLGGHAMTAITAVTAQNTVGVQAVHLVPSHVVIAQIESCISDIGVDAVKIGMIGSAETAHAVADYLEKFRGVVPLVFDPVMIATSGSVLADHETRAAFSRLMQIADVVTPNVPELAALTEVENITSVEAMENTASLLARKFDIYVLAKGGHLGPQPDDASPTVHDLLIFHAGVVEYFSPRVNSPHTHGTGCTLASAVATGLGQGLNIENSVGRGIDFVKHAIKFAPRLGMGNGPLAHSFDKKPFYLALKDIDENGWDATELAARWADEP